MAEKVKVIGREKAKLEEEMKEIESALDALFKSKQALLKSRKTLKQSLQQLRKNKQILNKILQNKCTSVGQKFLRYIKIKTAKKNSWEKAGETKRTGGKKDFEIFLEGQILELEGELECPVCLEVASTSPIYKCMDDHLLCRFGNLFDY